MAYENPILMKSFEAAADLSSYQFHFVKMTANNTVGICAAVTDKPIGILQNTPNAAGKSADVMIMGISKLVVGGGVTLSVTELVGTDASGEGDDIAPGTDITQYVCGQVIIGAGAGELATVAINCANIQREAHT